VSTDYDVASKLYFEPLALESVLDILELERPHGVLVQFGGQTPLKLSRALAQAGWRILGTGAEDIDLAEDRGRFAALLDELGIARPEYGSVLDPGEALAVARRVGFPVLVRPSYVLGGRAMQIVYDETELAGFVARAVAAMPDAPVLIDRFLEDAFEFDVDALADGEDTYIAGTMQHIEEAGVHSGDSECLLPPYQISGDVAEQLALHTRRIARALGVRGLLNMQFALLDGVVYVIEANPRASRTVPFVSKATGLPLARLATDLALGARLRDLELPPEGRSAGCAVKKPVFPFNKFPDASVFLGPEMRSTGEVMAWAPSIGQATQKAWVAAGSPLPLRGAAYISLNDRDKRRAVELGRAFHDLGFALRATRGTAAVLESAGLAARVVNKVREGTPDIADEIAAGHIQLIVNTPLGRVSRYDENAVGRAALRYGVPMVTTISGGLALARAVRAQRDGDVQVLSLQERLTAWGTAPRSEPHAREATRG
jgi:carbamoyl-phosphate synthase large subunit